MSNKDNNVVVEGKKKVWFFYVPWKKYEEENLQSRSESRSLRVNRIIFM